MNLTIPDFAQGRVLVVGDLMLDRYWHGSTDRISPEAPVPVVHVGGMEERAGGAGNVALNAVALGGSASLVGITGDDTAGRELSRLLGAAGVDCHFQVLEGAATISKLRVVSRHQQLIRLDFEDGFPNAGADEVGAKLDTALDGCGAVVLSDYAKGTLREPTRLIARAREAGCPVIVDPKGRDFSRYRGASLLTPNLAEFEGVAGKCRDADELVERARELCRAHDIEALLVTRGEHGMTLVQRDADPVHLAARARDVFDVTGAGDTVVATVAASLAAGAGLPLATALANVAAGIVVGKLGTATASVAELRRALHDQDREGHGVVDEAALLRHVRDARARGDRIVMTNGCFDLLHAGHVGYLEQARDRGDRLIVAVNDDASTRRLKGAGRPITPLEQRMEVLAGLAAVDWVVAFGEDTPARLIGEVLPDVLVKGGDYRPEQVAGHDVVVGSGGRVEVLDYLDGCSTTGILERIARATGERGDATKPGEA